MVVQRKIQALALLSGLSAVACATPSPSPIERRTLPPLRAATATVAAPQAPPMILPPCDPEGLLREELKIQSAAGIEIFVMRVAAPQARGAIVLTHGAGSASSAIWDLRTPGYSVLRQLACSGLDAYALDVRGFGGSTRPPKNTMVRAKDAVADVKAVLDYAQQRSGFPKMDLLGWSWGSDVAAATAGRYPQQIKRLVLIAPVYDRRWPTRHSEDPAWKKVEKADFDRYFDPAIEERTVLDEHVAALFRFADEQGELWLPSGPYRDLYGADAPVWDPKAVRAPTLIVRGEKDPASQAEPVARLFAALGSPTVVSVELPGEGHFPFRTKRHLALQEALAAFLSD